MKSVLILSRYGEKGASSRLRLMQYIGALRQCGFRICVSPLFEDSYLDNLYGSGRRSMKQVGKAYWTRVKKIIGAGQYDIVWIEKELFPFMPGLFERLAKRLDASIVVDFDDAIFHNYDLHKSAIVRGLLANKLKPLLRHAAAVTAGNQYLADYLSNHGATRVVRVPTVVDVSRYEPMPPPPDPPLRIGWIGSPSTASYLDKVDAPLTRIAAAVPIKLVTIGAPALESSAYEIEQHTWSEDSEAKLLSSVHVGIMPLTDSSWERGKCGYKLIQYMATGRPVVASPVGVNCEIVSGDVGFLASSEDDWFTSLLALASDPELRKGMGIQARRHVRERYSLQVTGPQIVKLFEELRTARTVG